MVIHLQVDEIRIPVGTIQRSDFSQGQILKADVRRAALDRNIAVQAAVGITVNRQLARPGNTLNLRSGRLVNFAGAAGQINNHIRAEKTVVDCLHRVTQRAEISVAGAGIGRVHIQIQRPAIGRRHGIGDHLIGVQLLEAHVAVGAHFHEHIFIVGRIKQLEQKVLCRDRHVVGADIDAGAFHFFRARSNPLAARVPFQKVGRGACVQPQHIRVQCRGRCAAAVDLLGVVGHGADLEGDVVGVLRDA